ncbi:hypothetical protein [Streptomyces sp. NPDC055210]
MTWMAQGSDDVLAPLRRHVSDPSYQFDVGTGWRRLVLECHQAVVAEFPEYEILAVKQKWAVLSFQARPRTRRRGGSWTDAEDERLQTLIDAFTDRSEAICERCGAHGSLRESRRIDLVLCDQCEPLVPEHGRL